MARAQAKWCNRLKIRLILRNEVIRLDNILEEYRHLITDQEAKRFLAQGDYERWLKNYG